LFLGSNVAPDQRRPHHVSSGIEHDRTMHLPRETDTSYVMAGKAVQRKNFADCELCRAPPVIRMLFSPPRVGSGKRGVFLSGRIDDPASLVDYESPCAARANIDS
jgi:hypothetical protein